VDEPPTLLDSDTATVVPCTAPLPLYGRHHNEGSTREACSQRPGVGRGRDVVGDDLDMAADHVAETSRELDDLTVARLAATHDHGVVVAQPWIAHADLVEQPMQLFDVGATSTGNRDSVVVGVSHAKMGATVGASERPQTAQHERRCRHGGCQS
jgi:hypothetical protein